MMRSSFPGGWPFSSFRAGTAAAAASTSAIDGAVSVRRSITAAVEAARNRGPSSHPTAHRSRREPGNTATSSASSKSSSLMKQRLDDILFQGGRRSNQQQQPPRNPATATVVAAAAGGSTSTTFPRPWDNQRAADVHQFLEERKRKQQQQRQSQQLSSSSSTTDSVLFTGNSAGGVGSRVLDKRKHRHPLCSDFCPDLIANIRAMLDSNKKHIEEFQKELDEQHDRQKWRHVLFLVLLRDAIRRDACLCSVAHGPMVRRRSKQNKT